MSAGFVDDMLELERTAARPFDAPAANPHKAIAKAEAAATYPCDSCGGSGIYRGVRIHQPESRCFACNGRGYFKTSTADRYAARAKAAARKVAKADARAAAFAESNGPLVERLTAISGWNSYARDMLESVRKWGSLTDNQAAACERMFAKIDAREAEKAAAKAAESSVRAANSGSVDVSRIGSLFATARGNGLNKVAFIAGDLKLKPAKDSGRNPGALYVTRGGEYQGKIMGGTFSAVNGALADTLPRLVELAADPAGVARFYGRQTGVCCCCGRELTDPDSVAAGIGPICATKWGL